MSRLRELLARIRGLFGRARRDRELEEEFAAHVQMEMDEYLRRGVPPDEARRVALANSGGLERAKEAYRDQRGLPWADAVASELLAAAARLRRHPGALFGSALSLALGMALATAVFSMVDALFLHPLPYPNQEQLVRIRERDPKYNTLSWFLPAGDVLAAESDSRSFSGVAASQSYGNASFVGASGHAVRVPSSPVTPNYFAVLGVRPMLGRGFTEADAASGSAVPPVILSYALWTSQFGQQSDIVGKTVPVDGKRAVVVGVMPAGFDMPVGTQLWMPVGQDSLGRLAASANRGWEYFATIGRLKPGMSIDRANADLSTVFHRAALPEGSVDRVPTSDLLSLAREVTAGFRDELRLWVAAAIVVILLCAVNFATMALARGMRRREELGVRLALGATRRRVTAMLVSETALMAVLGGAFAMLFAAWLLNTRHLWFGGDVLPVTPTVDGRVVAFGMVGTLVIGVLFGLAPAIELSRTDLRPVLSGGSWSTGGAREIRSRRGLVALQLGLSLACMAVLAALVVAEQQAQGAGGPGYEYSHMISANLYVPGAGTGAGITSSLVEAVRAIPGVADAAVVRAPLGLYGAALLYPDWRPQMAAGIAWQDVSPEYFRTLGLRLIAGRLPSAAEMRARAPVMVISKSSAKWLFGDGAALGHRVGVATRSTDRPNWFTVIGIVPDVRAAPNFDPLSAPVYTVQALPADGVAALPMGGPQG
ncbi:MAG: ABC transporter permease, partial [Gemmatimonadaceae bacterium]